MPTQPGHARISLVVVQDEHVSFRMGYEPGKNVCCKAETLFSGSSSNSCVVGANQLLARVIWGQCAVPNLRILDVKAQGSERHGVVKRKGSRIRYLVESWLCHLLHDLESNSEVSVLSVFM